MRNFRSSAIIQRNFSWQLTHWQLDSLYKLHWKIYDSLNNFILYRRGSVPCSLCSPTVGSLRSLKWGKKRDLAGRRLYMARKTGKRNSQFWTQTILTNGLLLSDCSYDSYLVQTPDFLQNLFQNQTDMTFSTHLFILIKNLYKLYRVSQALFWLYIFILFYVHGLNSKLTITM